MATDPELPNHSHLDEVNSTVGRLFVRALATGWKITENPKATPRVDRRLSGHAGWFAAIERSKREGSAIVEMIEIVSRAAVGVSGQIGLAITRCHANVDTRGDVVGEGIVTDVPDGVTFRDPPRCPAETDDVSVGILAAFRHSVRHLKTFH